LENLLKYLEVQDQYDLLGHAWDAILCAQHAVHRPSGLKRLILFSGPADMGVWVNAQWDLRRRLPAGVQDTLSRHEREGTVDSKEYEKAMRKFRVRHFCNVTPMPEEIVSGLEEIKKDPTVNMTMYVLLYDRRVRSVTLTF
jgi:L-proline amide hydrolase